MLLRPDDKMALLAGFDPQLAAVVTNRVYLQSPCRSDAAWFLLIIYRRFAPSHETMSLLFIYVG